MATDVNKPPTEVKTVTNGGEHASTELAAVNMDRKTVVNEVGIGDEAGTTAVEPPTRPGAEQIASVTVEELLGKVPIRAKRGRPRKRGLSMDPSLKQGSDDMMTVLLGIRQDNAVLKTDILSNIDTKMAQFKVELSKDLGGLSEQVKNHNKKLESIQEIQKADRLEIRELDSKFQGLEDEIDMIRKTNLKDVRTVVEQLAEVETSLARDIESIRVSAEEKFDETKKYQMLAEDRMQEISAGIVKENEQFRLELKHMKATIDQLQQPSETSNENPKFSVGSTQSDINGHSTQTGETESVVSMRSDTEGSCTSAGSGASTLHSVPDLVSDTQVNNMDRSIIISGIRENPMENLMLIVLDMANDIGINLKSCEIERVYRIGAWEEKMTRPRPVKMCVC